MSHDFVSDRLRESVAALQRRQLGIPDVALVLGSGLGGVVDALSQAQVVEYGEVPHMPRPAVHGHAGRFVAGQLGGRAVVAMQGRVHAYEGHSAAQVVWGVRTMLLLGARALIVSNAAGGIGHELQPGDLMLIDDHLNLTGDNPLRGPHEPALGPRFPDLSAAYDPELRTLTQRVAAGFGQRLPHGVYAGLLGPNYETPAEIRMLRTLGADAVGMSTVLEVIAARHMGARVLGISCITNLAAGLSDHALSHSEVEATAHATRARFAQLLEGVLQGLGS
jgi:purine-nucleoside phosphorylase